jgi:hypothetical protein
VTDATVRAVDIAQPAVVRIITSINTHLRVHFSATNTVIFPQNSTGYLLEVSGSGTFITSHGDIVTADHVVNPPHDQPLAQFLDQQAAQGVADYINTQSATTRVTQAQVLQDLESGQLPSDPVYDTPTSTVFLSTAYTGPLSAPDFQRLPPQVGADVDNIEKESAVNQKDVAIIHAPFKDMPSAQLGNSSAVQIQDTLTIIGFPGNADVSKRPTDLLTSSVNKINVSSIKTTDTGAPVIQVSGNVEHGDSGGPALDNQGNIVGIVSFGIANPDAPGSTNGTSFLQASNSASELVNALNLDTKAGPFQKLWSQAFNDYAATTPGHWHTATQELSQLATSYPLFQGVKPYLLYAQAQAKTERLSSSQTSAQAPIQPSRNTPSTNSLIPLLLPIALVVLLVLIVVLLLVLVLGNRRRRNTASAATALKPPLTTMPVSQQNGPNMPPFHVTPTPQDTRTAFGAQAAGGQPNQPPGSMSNTANISAVSRPWPCGHLNRPNARFCSLCGEPAPTTIRREKLP